MAWIYENNYDNSARYVLGHVVDGEPLICIGVNPSTAAPEDLDKTVSRVKKFSRLLGYESWIMLNLYPQRATDPHDLHSSAKDELIKENLKHIRAIIEKYKPTHIWASWGIEIEGREYLFDSLTEIIDACTSSKTVFFHLGALTKKGHPRHPSRLAYSSKKHNFDIQKYVQRLLKFD